MTLQKIFRKTQKTKMDLYKLIDRNSKKFIDKEVDEKLFNQIVNEFYIKSHDYFLVFLEPTAEKDDIFVLFDENVDYDFFSVSFGAKKLFVQGIYSETYDNIAENKFIVSVILLPE